MYVMESIRVALRALTANKLRSALTMLGIVIGVGAVVALMGIGNGASQSITSQVEGIGSNLVSVLPGRLFEGGRQGQAAVGKLYYSDYRAIGADRADIAGIAPSFQASLNVKYGSRSLQTSVTGTVEEFAQVRAYKVARGRFLTQNDGKSQARVVVLGSQTSKDLFGGLNPVGRKIKIAGIQFEVIGVLESKGSSGFGSADDLLLVPIETGYSKLFGASAANGGIYLVTTISVSAKSPEVVNALDARIERTLRRTHRLGPGAELDFSVSSQTDFLSTISSITTTLTVFLGAIAAISLLVGGIGIMNIMLVSVTERTREIGLRKAVGARRSAILVQFLIETVILSVLGGLIGIGLGMAAAGLVSATGLITSVVTIQNVALAFSFAVAVGLFFGIYPAVRASRLLPMEALRYE